MTTIYPPIPPLKLTTVTKDIPEEPYTLCDYHLEGWAKFDDWAYCNEIAYHNITKYANNHLNASNEDRYRMLIWEYVNETNRLRRELAEYQLNNPAPVMGPHGQVWRYIGP